MFRESRQKDRGNNLRKEVLEIARDSISRVLPDKALAKVLSDHSFRDKIILVSVGKAAWRMAREALEKIPSIEKGVVLTKYGHSPGPLPPLRIFEAGHPIPDENSFRATMDILKMVEDLHPSDTVLFLLSGGGSALFEKPLPGISLDEFNQFTRDLLECGASIVEINTLRKRLSSVKAGRFANHVSPGKMVSVILSDVLGDRIDSIASGPAFPDSTSVADVHRILQKYHLQFSPKIMRYLEEETPKEISNVNTHVIGSVRILCEEALSSALERGFIPDILTTSLDCEAREAGAFIAAIAREKRKIKAAYDPPLALIFGGETVVRVRGKGIGGRNQELALSAAKGISGLDKVVVLSIGSDGTDGPTDAAGAVVDGETLKRLEQKGMDIDALLYDNDSYHALEITGDLIRTGPTGTNVNDLTLLLIG
ncbi:MAG: glycerate kinase [Synergistales bacterium]|nr:glycerate kinase [Synergistales bacterium]